MIDEQAGQSTPAPRQWEPGSKEPMDVAAVRSAQNDVVFKARDSKTWGRDWLATQASGGDGQYYRWFQLNSDSASEGAMTLVEVLPDALPLSSVSPSGENTTPVGAEGKDDSSTAQGASEPDIPEMRVGMVDGTWVVAMADSTGGWVAAGTWDDLTNDDVADWTEIGPAVDADELHEELYNRAVAAENELARRLPLPDSETEWGWRSLRNPGLIMAPLTEEGARRSAASAADVEAVCREVGPWTEVQP